MNGIEQSKYQISEFSKNLISWHKYHGRHNLPWQKKINPYKIWISEVMLQQTQVKTVLPYYEKFINKIFIEWRYQTENGIPNIKNPLHESKLRNILKEKKLDSKVINQIIKSVAEKLESCEKLESGRKDRKMPLT